VLAHLVAVEFMPAITGLFRHRRFDRHIGSRLHTALPEASVTHRAVLIRFWLGGGLNPLRQETAHWALKAWDAPVQAGALVAAVKLYDRGGHVHLCVMCDGQRRLFPTLSP
jgi:hypothetical protein